jgi:hypothetical protein
VVALSGFLEHAQDGQRIAFAFLLNEVPNISTARGIVDAAVGELAQPRRLGPDRPRPPPLRAFRSLGVAGFAELSWDAVPGVSEYLVWLSADCARWHRDDARLVQQTRVVLDGLAGTTCARVTALGGDGYESDPSATFAATAASRGADLLLVDGNDRWRAEPTPENTLAAHHTFIARLSRALPGRSVETVHHGEIALGAAPLDDYGAILWAAGEQSATHSTLDRAQQSALATYLGAGGSVLLSGAEILWDLQEKGDSADRTFVRDTLGVDYVADDAGSREAEGVPGTAFAALPATTFLAPDGMDVRTPDALAPLAGSEALLRYVGGSNTAAMVGRRQAGALILTGFPLESVASMRDLEQYLGASLRYLGVE